MTSDAVCNRFHRYTWCANFFAMVKPTQALITLYYSRHFPPYFARVAFEAPFLQLKVMCIFNELQQGWPLVFNDFQQGWLQLLAHLQSKHACNTN